MTSAVSLSIVTVTHNSSQDLRSNWSHLNSGDFEWIVVDNASTDDSPSLAAAMGATSVIRLDRNSGFANASNLGATIARGSYLGFVNPDVIVDSRGLAEVRACLEENNWIVSPQLLNKDNSLQPNGRGAPFLLAKILGRVSPTTANKHHYYRYKQTEEPVRVEWLIGASVFLRSATFRQLGGWDSRYFLYYEDSDFGIRAGRLSIPSYLIGSQTWVHEWGRATKHPNVAAWLNEISSAIRFYKTYPEFLWGRGLVNRK